MLVVQTLDMGLGFHDYLDATYLDDSQYFHFVRFGASEAGPESSIVNR
jgi:hypothetical protein